MRAIRRLTVRPVLPEPLGPLQELAANLRWSWHPPTQDLFAAVDPALWQATGDPGRLLGDVSPSRLDELSRDLSFVDRLAQAQHELSSYLTDDRWYQREHQADGPRCVAYFSPEYGITAVLPQYSGGLGILAGDHLKTASDMGAPLIGVGLLYRSGYFGQSLSRQGWQQERYPVLDPEGLPLTLLREADGTVPRVSIGLPGGRRLAARIWVAAVGRVPLLLLDSDDTADAELGVVTDRLYGGGVEHRLLQEMLLGIGGVRALRTYARLRSTPAPEVFHTNEGHAGFLGLERIRELVEDDGLDFATALEVTRAGTVFTTHTPVPAGIDRFPRWLIEQHFGGDSACSGVPVERVVALGAEDMPEGDPEMFNMAVMGLRLASRANGVSRLHGQVSRSMFSGLWPGFDEAEVPIGFVTNGVHAPTWVAPELLPLIQPDEKAAGDTVGMGARTLWEIKRSLRQRLVSQIRARLRTSWLQRGAAPAELGWVESVFDPDVLTIGFARRVPSYKRLTLMLSDPTRLRSLLLDPARPIQLVLAGKAHPADDGGKRLIQEMVRFSDDPAVRHRIVFLPDFDIGMAQALIPGCDVWLNNPLRPYEACGTSGMKAALNAGLNLSILDGWWDEWYDGDNGWAIPSADGVEDPDRRDQMEAEALYDLVEKEVTARFYDRDDDGLPARWLEMAQHTLRSLAPKVLSTRMLAEYVDLLYSPTASSVRALDGDHEGARSLASWKQRVRAAWPGVRIESVEATGADQSPQIGATLSVRALVTLGDLLPSDVSVSVELGRVGDDDVLQSSTATGLQDSGMDESGAVVFAGTVVLDRAGPVGYTVRALPHHPLLTAPPEMGLVAWPRPPESVDAH